METLVVFLDTHVVVWLFADADQIPLRIQNLLDKSDLFISPMVRLELSFLAEIGRIKDPADAVIGALARDINLSIEEAGWLRAAEIADHLSFTRDPFDRLITSHAVCYGAPLCTRDSTILANYAEAFWE